MSTNVVPKEEVRGEVTRETNAMDKLAMLTMHLFYTLQDEALQR